MHVHLSGAFYPNEQRPHIRTLLTRFPARYTENKRTGYPFASDKEEEGKRESVTGDYFPPGGTAIPKEKEGSEGREKKVRGREDAKIAAFSRRGFSRLLDESAAVNHVIPGGISSYVWRSNNKQSDSISVRIDLYYPYWAFVSVREADVHEANRPRRRYLAIHSARTIAPPRSLLR